MTDIVKAAAVVLLLAVSWFFYRLPLILANASDGIILTLDNRLRDATGELRTATAVINLRTTQALSEVAAIRQDLASTESGLTQIADARLGEATAALTEVSKLREDLQPTITVLNATAAGYGDLARSGRQAIEEVQPETIKLLRDARTAAAQTARAAGQVERSMPELLDNAKRMTDASADASGHLSATFANLEKQTAKQALWLRLLPDALKTAIFALGILK